MDKSKSLHQPTSADLLSLLSSLTTDEQIALLRSCLAKLEQVKKGEELNLPHKQLNLFEI